jgi:hypothetical protein
LTCSSKDRRAVRTCGVPTGLLCPCRHRRGDRESLQHCGHPSARQLAWPGKLQPARGWCRVREEMQCRAAGLSGAEWDESDWVVVCPKDSHPSSRGIPLSSSFEDCFRESLRVSGICTYALFFLGGPRMPVRYN